MCCHYNKEKELSTIILVGKGNSFQDLGEISEIKYLQQEY